MRGFFSRRGPSTIILTTTFINNVVTGSLCHTSFVVRGVGVRYGMVDGTCSRNIGGLLFLNSAYVCPGSTPRPVGRSILLASPLRCAGRRCTVTGVTKLGVYRDCGLRCNAGCVTIVPAGLCNPGSGFRLRGDRIVPTVVHGVCLTGLVRSNS